MFLQLLISGIAMGFVYALVGIEYTLIWNSCMLLNFAHGQLIMLGAYIFGGLFITGLGVSFIMGWVGTIALVIILGVILAYCIFIPLKDVGRLYAIVATLMFGMIITECTSLTWGVYPIYVSNYLSGIFKIGDIIITKVYAYIMIAAIIIVAALLCFMKLTKTGKAMRCVSENKSMAALVGINVKNNMVITITISTVICAIVGMMVAPLFSISLTMANTISSKGFISAILGCFGSVPGAILGGIIVGALENVATIYIDAVYRDIVSFIILIIVIMFKPSGLLGTARVKITGSKSRQMLRK